MIRNGVYTLYQGKEYMLGETILENEPIKYWVKSMDSNDLANGFYLYERPKTMIIKGVEYELPPREIGKPNVYLKDITPSEVDEVYDVSTFGYYEGYLVVINSERENTYCLGVPENQALARKLGFEEIERGVLRKWVPKEKVERIFEEKRPLPHFFGL
ncbi:hypothetical protein [Neisseria sp. Ec49-e6-T10]|uniref:hypothetical protein n=1 Tax=Neisseria sp. Ec49-e6-T10 TaxID=3140744 RepID=UPI003EB8BFEB